MTLSDVSKETMVMRLKHPTWGDARVFLAATYNVMSGRLHSVMDVAGLIPGAGEIADAINGGLYTLEGNAVDASLSFAGMLPIGGQLATAGKWARNAMKFVGDGFQTASGLTFKLGSRHGNRLSHVLAHTANDLSRDYHGVFELGDDLVETLDSAWDMVKQGRENVKNIGDGTYIIDMGKKVGYEGGKKGSGDALTKIKIVVEENTENIITAYPIN